MSAGKFPLPMEAIEIAVPDGTTVSGLWCGPANARFCMVFAHGAGAGMRHPFMTAVAGALGARGVATLRFQFPFIEAGGRRPDPPPVAHATVRAAVAAARELAKHLPLFAAGKSFGGRMMSQAQAAVPLQGVAGLAFLGFPLHPPGKPSTERARHLSEVRVPMLFLQGTRDELAELALLEPVVDALRPRARLHVIDDADHAFHVRKRSGGDDAAALNGMIDALVGWMAAAAAPPPAPLPGFRD